MFHVLGRRCGPALRAMGLLGLSFVLMTGCRSDPTTGGSDALPSRSVAVDSSSDSSGSLSVESSAASAVGSPGTGATDTASITSALKTATAAPSSSAGRPPKTLTVPKDAATIQAAVDQAVSGDLIMIEGGTYHEAVTIRTPGVTLRGADRNTVILDGQDQLENGVTAAADGIVIENLTTRAYQVNGIVFTKKYEDDADTKSAEDVVLKGYRASYITSSNNGLYGIYAFYARDGQIDHSYVSGNPDGGIYIGQCKPCNALVTDVVGERNAQGFLGTNASGNLFVVNSQWRDNAVGVLVQSENIERLAPQEGAVIVGNVVENNLGDKAPPYKTAGVGIAVGGGSMNLVVRNLVRGHKSAGIIVTSLEEFLPGENRVVENTLMDNNTDLVFAPASIVARWSSAKNCFEKNTFAKSVPPAIESTLSCAASPSDVAGAEFSLQGESAGVDYRSVPNPPNQPGMPDVNVAVTPAPTAGPTIDITTVLLPKVAS